jgi:hypothetical protein
MSKTKFQKKATALYNMYLNLTKELSNYSIPESDPSYIEKLVQRIISQERSMLDTLPTEFKVARIDQQALEFHLLRKAVYTGRGRSATEDQYVAQAMQARYMVKDYLDFPHKLRYKLYQPTDKVRGGERSWIDKELVVQQNRAVNKHNQLANVTPRPPGSRDQFGRLTRVRSKE